MADDLWDFLSDPGILAALFDEFEEDVSDWSGAMSDSELLRLVEATEKEHAKEIEAVSCWNDVSFDDHELRRAVEEIEASLSHVALHTEQGDTKPLQTNEDTSTTKEESSTTNGADLTIALLPKRKFSFRRLTEKQHRISPKAGQSVLSVIEHPTARGRSRSFAKPTPNEELLKLSRKQFASETDKKICWVLNMYSEWRKYRNNVPGYDAIELDLTNVATITKANVVFAMTRFLAEVKKLDGNDFPPKTLYEIFITVQFHLETIGFSWKLLDDEAFKDLKFTLDNLMKVRCRSGLGNSVRQAQVITFEEEDRMWQNGVLGVDTPEKLVRTLVYLLGLSCALRAGKEHRVLRALDRNSQFCLRYDDDGYRYLLYREDLCTKTNRGGIRHKKYTAKTVNVYPARNPERCPVTILEFYMSKLPTLRKCDALYLRPLSKVAYYSDVWFRDAPMGVNSLQSVVKNLCKESGLEGHYSNHSLRATAATRMYHGGNEEQVIQEHTGHRSLCVRSYKKTGNSQKRKACESIYCRKQQAKFLQQF